MQKYYIELTHAHWQVTELNLDNVRASVISGLTDEFSNLVKLSLVNVGLTSLDNFPILSKLEQVSELSAMVCIRYCVLTAG